MSETSASVAPSSISHAPGSPCWVDSASPQIEASKSFYAGLFGWEMNTVPDPEAGGYAIATLAGAAIAALGPLQEGQLPAWSVYFATPDADETARKVEAAGGKVVAPPFDVMESGRMAGFQDPTGAYFSVWQANAMPGFAKAYEPNTFGWCELNTRGIVSAEGFYAAVFDWGAKRSQGGDGARPYVEWQLDGTSIGGAIELSDLPGMEDVPPHWLVYFSVPDIDAAAKRVAELGGVVQKGPEDYPGGRFAIVGESTGARFGLMQLSGE